MKNFEQNKKPAVVDQILLWIVLFIIFVGFLFFVIDYSNAMKVKDNSDALADYTARMVALGKTDAEVVEGLNNIKDDYIATISEADLNCVEDLASTNYQVIVNIYATLNNSFLPVANDNVHSRTVVFNEASEVEKECSITLSFN
ncbi:hypothetical protein CRV03_09730 [Arcobacter sp. F155]|uniref:TadE/TadG family type IV pilus assembly protein n=1 Tax=Arcobacteraceae TaxID=2808963 RepID=UPI00100BEB10|nr:Tad domain-containing protein [Arcobacter sp. F155]RXJ76373.1 hypothetical protein CRV03_09730 [Arcobacter sp. F155]